MDLIKISDILDNRLSKDLIKLRPILELQFPFVSKNGYDENVPYIFVQNNLFIEIWNMAYYTDHQHTWETGMVQFSYTIQELLKGHKLKIIDVKNPQDKTNIYSLNEFKNEWILENPPYKHFIEKIYKY